MKDYIESTLKLIDEGNKSFILHPLSFIPTDEGNTSFILYLLAMRSFISSTIAFATSSLTISGRGEQLPSAW